MKVDFLRVGIAGYGVVGKRRGDIIARHPRMALAAVCDQRFLHLGVSETGARQYANYQQMLNDTELDVLFVCLPTFMAAEVTIAGLEKNLHVFCEKPPGCTPADIQQVIEVEKRHPHLHLKYGFNHRYHDSVREALRLIENGELGPVVNLRGVYGKSKIIPFSGGWRSERRYAGGGILLDQGIHMVDLMRLFCGEFPEVKSFISNGYWGHDVEDNAYALMKDDQGRVAMLHSSATQWQHRFSLDIALTEGYIELNGILTGSKSYGQEKLVIGRRDEAVVGSLKTETLLYLEDNSWRDEIYDFAETILKGQPNVHGRSADALATMDLVFKIYHEDDQWRDRFLNSDAEKGGL